MRIFLQTEGGQPFPLDVEPADTIALVKGKIFEPEEVALPLDEQEILFDGKQLEDDRTLSHYNVQEGSILTYSPLPALGRIDSACLSVQLALRDALCRVRLLDMPELGDADSLIFSQNSNVFDPAQFPGFGELYVPWKVILSHSAIAISTALLKALVPDTRLYQYALQCAPVHGGPVEFVVIHLSGNEHGFPSPQKGTKGRISVISWADFSEGLAPHQIQYRPFSTACRIGARLNPEVEQEKLRRLLSQLDSVLGLAGPAGEKQYNLFLNNCQLFSSRPRSPKMSSIRSLYNVASSKALPYLAILGFVVLAIYICYPAVEIYSLIGGVPPDIAISLLLKTVIAGLCVVSISTLFSVLCFLCSRPYYVSWHKILALSCSGLANILCWCIWFSYLQSSSQVAVVVAVICVFIFNCAFSSSWAYGLYCLHPETTSMHLTERGALLQRKSGNLSPTPVNSPV